MVKGRLVAGAAMVAAAVTAGGIAGAVIGVPGLSGASTSNSSSSTSVPGYGTRHPGRFAMGMGGGALLKAAAGALHLTPQQLQQKLSDGKTTIADVAKQQNVNIDAVINAMVGADRQHMQQIVNSPWPKLGMGPGGPVFGGRMGPMGIGRGLLGQGLKAAASALGITPAELKTDLRNGQTLAQIAQAHNVKVDTVINALVQAGNQRIDQAVANKRLTQAQADKLKAQLPSLITNFANNGFKGLGAAGFGGLGGPGGFGAHNNTSGGSA
ncbi:MAG TPA: hypothetical protein VN636_04455 [Acidimicrobiia bacterium]|nr:hypothetical protein [Acidimicrobiia bacterium]